jgi:HTH-type transcriptional regulator/antitoxin HipB
VSPHNIASVARQRRHSLGLTQVELADLAEVSERLIRDLEGGRLTIRTDKLLAILATLGLEIKINRTYGAN